MLSGMNLTRIQNVLLILLVMVMAVSLAFCTSLSLMEYLRLFILGCAAALIFAAYPQTFGKSYTRKSILGCAYAFILYALDPNTNSTIKFGDVQSASIAYRLLTGIIIIAAVIIWLIPIATREIHIKEWGKQFSRIELYVIAILVSFGLVGMVLEMLFIDEGVSSFFSSVLRGTKIIECIMVFMLITHALDSKAGTGNWRYTILVIALLSFCAFTSLVGGARAFAAYRTARLTKWNTSGKNVSREKLLRVFSLNSREAWTIYEAGYAAGKREWDLAHTRLKQAENYQRNSLVEAEALAYSAENQYAAAIRALESLPLQYTIHNDLAAGLKPITDKIKAGTEDASLSYLAGLLIMHQGRAEESHAFLDEFLSVVPNHANATFFRYHDDKNRMRFFKDMQMPAAGWLYPVSLVKSVKEEPGLITIMYNQLIRGTVWLEPGIYSVSVFARDDGTQLASAQETGFDPACKMCVWIGTTRANFTVQSTNRQFQSYQMNATITDKPTDVLIEFTNDIYNQARGWDRNLSVSRLTFRRKN